ncbi:hypothetical protein K2173_001112 [Erythroxylum novogranatense]|uniref:Sulfotransferase domain-containing protein n=1 Tax=Erythroxylum novogranatense TaxID=1862640 RepID=A0AAV8TKE5_9ROSI|nr:hypothetical protein K2173_001112 [Erythroxylum novogranatense]
MGRRALGDVAALLLLTLMVLVVLVIAEGRRLKEDYDHVVVDDGLLSTTSNLNDLDRDALYALISDSSTEGGGGARASEDQTMHYDLIFIFKLMTITLTLLLLLYYEWFKLVSGTAKSEWEAMVQQGLAIIYAIPLWRSHFDVNIFDLTISEINYPSGAPGSLQQHHESQCLENKVDEFEPTNISGKESLAVLNKAEAKCGSLNQIMQTYNEPDATSARGPKARYYSQRNVSKALTMRSRAAATESKERAVRAAHKFNPDYPYFRSIMGNYNVSKVFLLVGQTHPSPNNLPEYGKTFTKPPDGEGKEKSLPVPNDIISYVFVLYHVSVLAEGERFQQTYTRHNEIIQTLPKHRGRTGGVWQYMGFWFSSDVLKGLLLIQDRHFIPKSTDIFVATCPKSGTTWLKALIFATVNRTLFDFADHPLLTNSPHDLVPYLDRLICQEEFVSRIRDQPAPRIFATHFPYTLLPDNVRDSGCRFVYVCRDPKDILVSGWHFIHKLRDISPVSMQDAVSSFSKGVVEYGPFWDHMLSYKKASMSAPEKILFLTYEELTKDPIVQVKRLAEFVGMPFSVKEVTDGVVEKIVRLCSFENLQNLEVNKNVNSIQENYKNPDFFRKGEVGDWKNHLSPDMAAVIDEITEEKLKSEGINFSA